MQSQAICYGKHILSLLLPDIIIDYAIIFLQEINNWSLLLFFFFLAKTIVLLYTSMNLFNIKVI